MKVQRILFPIFFSFLLTGCASHKPVVPENGGAFLGEYDFEQTKAEEDEDNVLFSYWKKEAGWPVYTKIIVEPVAITIAKNSKLNKMPHADRAELQDFIEYHFRDELVKTLTLVNHPAVDTLILRLRLVDADVSEELVNSYAAIHPLVSALTALRKILSGLDLKEYKASLAAELVDSTTGDLLMTAVNANNDEFWEQSALDESEVRQLSRAWVKQLAYRLCRQQNRAACEMAE